jgi:NAD(P) transhydrogenase
MDGTAAAYDLFVIGSGPAGQRAAIQAAKMGKRVGLAEQAAVVGGVCINTGTIPSKTLREAIRQVSGLRNQALGGALLAAPGRGGQAVTMADLRRRVGQVVENEIAVSRDQLQRNGVELFWARATLAGPRSVRVEPGDGSPAQLFKARHVMIATGSATTVDPHIPFDGRIVLTSDDVLAIDRVPRTLVVVGAGVIGAEYASMFAALGVRVTLIDKRRELLPFLDSEIVASLAYQLRRSRVTLRLGEEVSGIERTTGEQGERVRIHLASGKQIIAEAALYSVGRTGATAGLGLAAAGLAADDRGRIAVNEHFETAAPGIYAVGDVIGFPALAATSMEQGRLAAAHAFGVPTRTMPTLLPYGLYTVPEISMVGRTEEQLTEQGVPYEVGTAQYREIARGQIVGDLHGLLKLIFHLETRELLGVHIIGEGAAELVHIGQAVMAFGGGTDYFVDAVFNYPTLAECYKTAAFDAINRMAELARPSARAA